jgi:hypothetical protein
MTSSIGKLAALAAGAVLCAASGVRAAATPGAEPDYRARRVEFAKRGGYDAYALQRKQYELFDRHRALADDETKSVSEVNEPLGELYRLNPLGIQVNRAIAGFLAYVASLPSGDASMGPAETARLRDMAKAAEGRADAILKSVLDSGDGRSRATAFEVINPMEEHAVLHARGFEASEVALVECDARPYDVFASRGGGGAMWFDVSLFHRKDAADPAAVPAPSRSCPGDSARCPTVARSCR